MSWTLVVTSNGMRRVSHPAESTISAASGSLPMLYSTWGKLGIPFPKDPSHQDEPLNLPRHPWILGKRLGEVG